jgi:hypothetical protein
MVWIMENPFEVAARKTSYVVLSFMTLTASNGRISDERWIGKQLEGIGHGLMEVLTRYLSTLGEEKDESKDSGLLFISSS